MKKRNRIKMAEQDALLLFLADHSLELIIGYDRYGCITYTNKKVQELTGYGKDELIGVYIGEIFRDVYTIIDNHISLAQEYKDKDIFETVVYRKNKTCFPVEVKTLTEILEGKEANFCLMVDMTRYKESIRKIEEATEQLKDSVKDRDSFVANVTHELRTPVNGIKGHTEIILDMEEDEKKQTYLRLILDCCNTMEGIINNILDFAKLEAGKFQLEERPFSFSEYIKKREKQFTAMVEQKGLHFVLNVAPEVPDAVIGDELRLTQVLNNLVSNAVKFTPSGFIGIEITKNMQLNDEVELFFMVVDTGIGLSPEDKDKLFKSFSQVDASITRKYGGTGLGLSICKELVNMMHGDIWADGEKGKGSSFSFTVRLKLQNVDETETVVEMPRPQPTEVLDNMVQERELMYEFGSEINRRELQNYYEKLNISMDMGNWYKAESFVNTFKQLVAEGPAELTRATFRLAMAVRKADYDKAREYSDIVRKCLEDEFEKRDTEASKSEVREKSDEK